MSGSPRGRPWIIFGAWLILMAVAFCLDARVAGGIARHPLVDKSQRTTRIALEIVKLPGSFYFTLFIAALIAILHRTRWVGASALLLGGIAGGAMYSLIKWAIGRHRPDHGITPFKLHPFAQGISGLWNEKALCFPSGHASLSFVTAACLSILIPKWRVAFFLFASCTALERVIENAHYCSDVVAGAGMGALIGWMVTRMMLNQARTTAPDGVPLSSEGS